MLKTIHEIQREVNFSGTVMVKEENKILAETSYGKADKAMNIDNEASTRFGIASGCKIFTAVAVCQLVEKGEINFGTKLNEILPDTFPHFDKGITIHHLLSHTSGIPDYFDEEEMDDFEALWLTTPMYTLRSPADFLPLFQNRNMKFTPEERFHYNNAGYIVLGLVVEKVSGMVFTDYVEKHIFEKAGMKRSGYFEFDRLPEDTASGYIQLDDGSFKKNIYALPVKGGADGGAFTTPPDMIRFWETLMRHELLSREHTETLLTPHAYEEGDGWYGYGVWMEKSGEDIEKYHVMGYDPGVSFHSAFYPKSGTVLAVCSNHSEGAYDVMAGIEARLKI